MRDRLLFGLFLLVIAGGCELAGGKAPTKLVVESPYVPSAHVFLGGGAKEEAWKESQPVEIVTKDLDTGKAGPTVEVKSVHSDKEIYLLFWWRDKTKDSLKKVWEFDGAGWKQGPDEDKLAVLWNKNNSIPRFASRGCRAVCHDKDKNKNAWYMATNGRRERMDSWVWGAGTSNTFLHADDRYLDDTRDAQNPRAATDLADNGESGFAKNIFEGSKEGTPFFRPVKKYLPGYDFERNPYPFVGQLWDITTYKLFKAGDKIPFIYFFGPPKGSRADVRAKGVWNKGYWTLEIERALDTGHPDDMPMKTSISEPVFYTFALAVFDGSNTSVEHFISDPVSLELK